MNVEYILFLSCSDFALQYTVFMKTSQNDQMFIAGYKKIHNIYYAAEITRYCSSMIATARYYINGILHRVCGPASMRYYDDGYMYTVVFYMYQKPHPHYASYIISADRIGKIVNITKNNNDTDEYVMYPSEAELNSDIVKIFGCKNEFQLLHFDK